MASAVEANGATYVIYYGWLTEDGAGAPNESALRIAAARVPLLIAHAWTAEPQRHLNLSPTVRALMRSTGTVVYAYVATRCGQLPLGTVEAAVEESLDAGADGIFFDEADPLRESAKLAYYAGLASRIRARGKRVIVNPGVAQLGENIMDVADCVMVEHRWRDLRSGSLWAFQYAAERFMGVSRNEENAMGYAVNDGRAIADTREAWRRGIGWHTSTDRYIELPAWFERYIEAVR